MDERSATQYLRWVRALPAAALSCVIGMLLTTAGAAAVGVPLFVVGFLLWWTAVLLSWIRAVRARDGRPWFGPRSVTEEANESLGWGRVAEAAAVLRQSPEVIRRQLVVLTITTLVAAVVLIVLGFIRFW